MRLYRCRYNDPTYDPAETEVYYSEKAWEGKVCHEIKSMLETLGCTNVTIVPDTQIDPSAVLKRKIGSPVLG